ncbi:hypothetical protein [Thermococcus celericrescens]|nr:hypothetical protein [Thermococcus celericrescens]
MEMKARVVLLITAIVLMISAALLPPERHSEQPEIFVPPNMENFTEELKERNLTDMWKCNPARELLVTCNIRDDWGMKRTVSAFSKFPHGSINLKEGRGEFEVTILNESAFWKELPAFCVIRGTKAEDEPPSQEGLEELNAFRELESILTDPEEREIIHNKTIDLGYGLGLKSEVPVCNVTVAHVILVYPFRKESNVPFMLALWAGVALIGAIGLVVVWRERD